MNRRLQFYFCLQLALSMVFCGDVLAVDSDFFVSPSGNDEFNGTADKPFKTLRRAQSAVRSAVRHLRPNSEAVITVNIADGIYQLLEPLAFGAEDSAPLRAKIVYRSLHQHGARLSGGVLLPVGGFKPILRDEAPKEIQSRYLQDILAFDLGSLRLRTDWVFSLGRNIGGRDEKAASVELVFDDEVATVARWPNSGWATVGDVVVTKGQGGRSRDESKEASFIDSSSRTALWAGQNVWVKGYWKWGWFDEALPISRIDQRTHTLTLAGQAVYGIAKGGRFIVVNALGELDAPGEYYIDGVNGKLYFWPPAPIESAPSFVTVSEQSLLEINNASNISFEGIVFENGRNGGATIRRGANVLFKDCIFRNFGTSGIDVVEGTNHSIQHSRIEHTGTRGVLLSGGDRRILRSSGHSIIETEILSVGRRIAASQPAIDIDGVGVRVTGNHIHDVPQIGILFAGNDHVIESNEIHNACREVSDSGAIYTGRDWTARGTVIRKNSIYDVTGYLKKGDVSAVYLDDMASGIAVERNTFSNVYRGVLVGGGRDNTVENNTFIQVEIPVAVDARGTHWGREMLSQDGVLLTRLNRLPYRSPPWSKRYPDLVDILDDEPQIPKRNTIINNILYKSGDIDANPIARMFGRISNNESVLSKP